jgi:lipoprotein-releasing system permease protein
MNFPLFIAKKLTITGKRTFTKFILRIASIAVGLSVLVVLLSMGNLFGFKKEIREKVSGYAGHFQVKKYNLSKGSESSIIPVDTKLIQSIQSIDGVKSVDEVIYKAMILKSDSVFEGLVFKGVGSNYDLNFFKPYLKSGTLPKYQHDEDSYDILVSSKTANALEKEVGDILDLYVLDESDVRRRRPKIAGIYNTGLQEFDQQFAICDLRMLQRLVSTDYNVATSYEITINKFKNLDKIQDNIEDILPHDLDVISIREQYESIFQWLEIVDTNVVVIIVLMILVAVINIITVLLILIIDRIKMIGLLKALGSKTLQITKIFSWKGIYILISGLMVANVIALLFAFLQTKYKLIKLDPETYYMDAVPFYLPAKEWIVVNIGAILIGFLFTLVPAILISKLKPIEIFRFG